MKLSDGLNKTISDFCHNRFTGSSENHCAHKVCTVLEVDSGHTCKIHKNGSYPGACLRVQELFARCPRVGTWSRVSSGMSIVFATDKANVDLTGHTMRNVPKKHVGIFSAGHVYHYSTTTDIVVWQTPTEFFARCQSIYGGNQGFFFGVFSPGARIPDPEGVPAVPSPVIPPPSASVGVQSVIRTETSGSLPFLLNPSHAKHGSRTVMKLFPSQCHQLTHLHASQSSNSLRGLVTTWKYPTVSHS